MSTRCPYGPPEGHLYLKQEPGRRQGAGGPVGAEVHTHALGWKSFALFPPALPACVLRRTACGLARAGRPGGATLAWTRHASRQGERGPGCQLSLVYLLVFKIH